MIAASGILVVIAFVTLIIGVFQTGLGLIWSSIAASVLAAIFLALGVVQANKRRIAPAGASGSPQPSQPAATWSDAPATAVIERQPAAVEEEEAEAVQPARPSLTAVPAVTPDEEEEYAPPKKQPAAPRARRAPAATAATVVVVPDRDKYHKETCRYAKNPAAMTMTKAAARRQGFTACGTCKP